MPTVLITTFPRAFNHKRVQAMLEGAGCQVKVIYPLQNPDEEEMIDLLQGVTGLIPANDPLTERVLKAAPSLRVIARTGVGVDNIDLKVARSLGIRVTITPGATSAAVADLTIGLILAVARRICWNDQQVRQGRWERTIGLDMTDKMLGLIGLGAIGKLVARRAQGFDMQLQACDQVQDLAFAAGHGIRYVDKDELLASSDYVSLHVPLTAETRGSIGERELRLMKSTACLINTARGPIVDEDALYRALHEGWIAGAGLDVFQREPPAGSPLLELDSVVMTPHVGAWTEGTWQIMAEQAATEVIRLLQGQPPMHAV